MVCPVPLGLLLWEILEIQDRMDLQDQMVVLDSPVHQDLLEVLDRKV
jgi:hypothetical protein